jgi:hypothetical protein
MVVITNTGQNRIEGIIEGKCELISAQPALHFVAKVKRGKRLSDK